MDISEFKEGLEFTAEWRREKAGQYHDARCARAADALAQLAAQVGELDGSFLFRRLKKISDELIARDTLSFCSDLNGYQGRIGFDFFPANGEELLPELIEIFSASLERAREAVQERAA